MVGPSGPYFLEAIMMKLYVMPDGLVRQYDEGKAPKGAKLLNPPVVEEKAVTTMKNKAVKGSKKK